jgi:hypothetical protein
VQFCVVPSCVITTFAVADPSYVMTSRLLDVAGDCPLIVIVADIARMTVPDVGYEGPLLLVSAGMTTAFTVSPVDRAAVKAPRAEVPVVVSVPADAPFTVRCVLPLARPVTV